MNLKNLNLRRCYTQGSIGNKPVEDFLKPCLENSKEFNIITGYFSSKLFEKIFSEIKIFLENNGKIKILTGWLYKEDLKILQKNEESLLDYFYRKFEDIVDDFEKLEKYNHLEILAWLILKKKLEIRFGTPIDEKGRPLILDDYMLHEKIGYFKDDDENIISFSGSANITISAWFYNREQFKVFNNWEPEIKEYCILDVSKFNRYWHHLDSRLLVSDISDLPERIIAKLKKYEKVKLEDLEFPEYSEEEKDQSNSEHYINANNEWLYFENGVVPIVATMNMWERQIEAIEYLEKRDYNGILNMATGTGKTRTAIRTIFKLFSEITRLLVIVAVPDLYLVSQWFDNLKMVVKEDIIVQIGGQSINKAKKNAFSLARDITTQISKLGIIIGTTNSMNYEFYERLKNEINENLILFIGDECHTLGAPITKFNLKDFKPQYRIGLSATPIRVFDDEGTNFITEFFKDDVFFKYQIREAQEDKLLMEFKYFAYIADISDEDIKKYTKLTKQSFFNQDNIENSKKTNLKLIQRANILKNNPFKLPICNEIIENLIKNKGFEKTVIYCYNKSDRIMESDMEDNRSQITKLKEEIINPLRRKYNNSFNYAIFDGSKSKNERLEIISKFDEKNNLVLIAIKCLDQGVDIPSLEKAIVLASSGTELEHIQRTGRLLRRNDEKLKRIDYVEIYDILSLPTKEQYSKNPNICDSIIRYEKSRSSFFVINSLNTGYNLILSETKILDVNEYLRELQDAKIQL